MRKKLEPRECSVCKKTFRPARRHQINCSRACTIHAADLRRKGLAPIDPGYVPGSSAYKVQETITVVKRMLYKERKKKEPNRDLMIHLETALSALLRVRKIKKSRA